MAGTLRAQVKLKSTAPSGFAGQRRRRNPRADARAPLSRDLQCPDSCRAPDHPRPAPPGRARRRPEEPSVARVDLDWTVGESSVDRWVRWDESVDVGEPEEPAHGVHHRDDGGVHQSGIAELADLRLDVSPLNADEWIQVVALAPGEPALQLVCVKGCECGRSTEPGTKRRPVAPATSRQAEREVGRSQTWTHLTRRGGLPGRPPPHEQAPKPVTLLPGRSPRPRPQATSRRSKRLGFQAHGSGRCAGVS